MENNNPKKLYPLHFEPVKEEMLWGSQTWALADLGFVNSVITQGWLEGNSMEDLMETYIDRAVGEACYQYYGRQFPVAIRYMDIQGDTPIQVHPGDQEAMYRYDALGKAQMFYIVEASEDARLYLGFNKEMTALELYRRCNDGSLKDVLNEIHPKPGDYYVVKPGLVNAFAGHLKVLVVQESSDINLVLFDKDETDDELKMTYISEAIDLVDYGVYHASSDLQSCASASEKNANGACSIDPSTELLVSRPEFTVSKVSLREALQMNLDNLGCFLIYTCVEGEASIQIPTINEKNEKCMESYDVKKGETVLVPAEIQSFFLVPRDRNTTLLETMVESHDELDEYIDPSTEPFLEGEDYEGLEDGDLDGSSSN